MPPPRNGSAPTGRANGRSASGVVETRGIRVEPTGESSEQPIQPGELGLPIELSPWSLPGFTDPQILRFDQGVTLDDLHRMTQRDGHARSMLNLMSWPMRAAKRTVEPDQDGDEEAEFIRDMFELPPHRGGMSTPMSYVMACHALAFRDAFAVMEKVVAVRDDGTQVLRKLSPRPARTLAFQYDDHGGLAGVVQKVRRRRGTGTEEAKIFIPPEKVLLFTVNKEESPLEGESLFLPAYYHFDKKHRLYYIAHLAAMVGATPMRVGKVAGGSAALRREFSEQLRSLGLNGSIAIPPGYEIETHQNGSILGDILALIEHHDVQMSKSILAHFIDIGTEGKGGLGTATTTSELGDLFIVALEAHLQDIAQGFSSYVIPYFIDVNFGSERYPTFSFEPFTDEQKQAMAETFTALFNAASPPTPEMLFEVQRSHAEALGLEGIDWDQLKTEFVRMEEEKRALESAQRKQAQGAAEVPVGPDGSPLTPAAGSTPPGKGAPSPGRARAKTPATLDEPGAPSDVELASHLTNPFLAREHPRDRKGKWVDKLGGAGSKPSVGWEPAEDTEAAQIAARPATDPVRRDRAFAAVLPSLSVARDTQSSFQDPDEPGMYIPERDDMHADLVAENLASAVAPPSDRKPRIFFTAGGPASGKTALRDLFDSPGPVIIDPDDFKKRLPEWKPLTASDSERREQAAAILHEESSDLASRTRAAAVDLGFDILVDQTGNSSAKKAVRKILDAQAAGYDVQMRMVDVPIDEAIRRADIRGAKTGRFVNHDVLRATHVNVAANLLAVIDETDADIEVYSSDVPEGTPHPLIASRKPGGELKIVPGQEPAWEALTAKAALRDRTTESGGPPPVPPTKPPPGLTGGTVADAPGARRQKLKLETPEEAAAGKAARAKLAKAEAEGAARLAAPGARFIGGGLRNPPVVRIDAALDAYRSGTTESPLPSGVDPRSFRPEQSAFVLDLLFDDFEAFSDFYEKLDAPHRKALRDEPGLTERVRSRLDVLDKPPPSGVPGYVVPPMADLVPMSKTELRKVIDASGKFPRGHANWLTPREIRAALHDESFEAKGYGSPPTQISNREQLDALVADRNARKGKPAVPGEPPPAPEPTPPPAPSPGPVPTPEEPFPIGLIVETYDAPGVKVQVVEHLADGRVVIKPLSGVLEGDLLEYERSDLVTDQPDLVGPPPPPPAPAPPALVEALKDRMAKIRLQSTDPAERMKLAVEVGQAISTEVEARVQKGREEVGLAALETAEKAARVEYNKVLNEQKTLAKAINKAANNGYPDREWVGTTALEAAPLEMQEAYAAVRTQSTQLGLTLRKRVDAIKAVNRSSAKLRAAAERDVLHSIRDFGVPTEQAASFVPKANELPSAQRKTATKALDHYPSDWYSQAGFVTYGALGGSGRAFYSYYERSINLAPNDRPQTAVHELGHHMEYTVPRLKGMARTLLNTRTKGEAAKWLGGSYRKDEVTKRDKFPEKYMGKIYSDGATEVFTVLMEGVFQERGRKNLDKDPELRAWLYGVLASL